MGLFSKLFRKSGEDKNVRQREDQPDVVDIQSEDERMNWAIEKANLTLHHFEECLKNPSDIQQYFSIKVKIIDGNKVEHLWLTNPSFDEEGNLFGVVGNNPIDVQTVALNQKIGIDRALISDWMIVENGRLIGGYTIRAIRDSLPANEVANFDKGLGGMIVDEGEDYFLPSNETPEGAIVQIEEAYNEDDLDKVLACKDFTKEAEMMLAKLETKDLGKEILEQTAEVLQLSFLNSIKENGMPKFNGIKRAFPKREKINDQHMIITEVCYYPDGGKSIQRINTINTGTGWKVLAPEN